MKKFILFLIVLGYEMTVLAGGMGFNCDTQNWDIKNCDKQKKSYVFICVKKNDGTFVDVAMNSSPNFSCEDNEQWPLKAVRKDLLRRLKLPDTQSRKITFPKTLALLKSDGNGRNYIISLLQVNDLLTPEP